MNKILSFILLFNLLNAFTFNTNDNCIIKPKINDKNYFFNEKFIEIDKKFLINKEENRTNNKKFL